MFPLDDCLFEILKILFQLPSKIYFNENPLLIFTLDSNFLSLIFK
jgi:hypothetical protein